MNYGFLIDNRRCIGCHACSVACKAEHEVPLGVARTWVKYVEKGVFPDTRRTFQVTRCNHCDDAPCVEICPTTALFRRKDGIVDFDGGRCIGCKACMQGCPYDALYIDPQTETAAKCNFCAHKVEVGLEPPCVDGVPDAGHRGRRPRRPVRAASRRWSAACRCRSASRRRGRGPRSSTSTATRRRSSRPRRRPPSDYMWAQAPADAAVIAAAPTPDDAGAPRRTYGVKEQHRNSWGWKVSAYLWTKSLAAGAFLVPAVLARGSAGRRAGAAGRPLVVALLALAVTGALLVWDLRQPTRFLWTLTRPQWRSWLDARLVHHRRLRRRPRACTWRWRARLAAGARRVARRR